MVTYFHKSYPFGHSFLSVVMRYGSLAMRMTAFSLVCLAFTLRKHSAQIPYAIKTDFTHHSVRCASEQYSITCHSTSIAMIYCFVYKVIEAYEVRM